MTAPELVQVLEDGRDHILALFVSEVQRGSLSPPGLSRSLLIDHIPTFLDEIVGELRRIDHVRFSQESIDTSLNARKHGGQRWGLGYDLDALIREYGVLRHCILQTAKQAGAQVSIDDVDVLSKCLSVGVAEAAAAYGEYRNDQLNAEKAHLQFLVEAGELLSSSLDYRSTLTRLTRLLVPRLADWCVVHLEGQSVEEMAIAHVDASKVEVLRDIYRSYPTPVDAPYSYRRVLQTGEAQLVTDVPAGLVECLAQNPEHLALLRTIDGCSWLSVPLRVQGTMFGALSMAYSDSRRHYEAHDLVLAKEVAGRAAVAIDNARLYELSQSERSRVEAATRAKDEFVAMVSHELRSPLNAILGWLRLMRSGKLPEAKREHAFDVIERNANAQSQLVADLLDVSRIIAGKIRISLAQVDLRQLVDIVVDGVRPAADAKRIRVDVHVDGNTTIRGDADRLQQVIWNLLTNALKFTPKEGQIRIGLRRVDSDLELTVADNGSGIPTSFLPHVFDSFRQSEGGSTRPHGGLGIGLSIAKHIVELHGGLIEAHSPGEGGGATFIVRLPVSALVSTTLGGAQVPATKQREADAPLPTGLEGIRVLVVDDAPDARELVAYLLESSGMTVDAAGSAAEALALLEKDTPDVLVSDIGMPHEDGYTLIRKIRTSTAEDKKAVPAIALTAFARNEDRTRALVEGFNVYMSKPVEPAALINAIAELAGRAKT